MTTNKKMDKQESDLLDLQLLGQLSHSYRKLMDSYLGQIKLHRAQAIILYRLNEQEGISQSSLAHQLGLHAATVTDMLQRMEEAEFIWRERDAVDQRIVRVYLTEAGRERQPYLKQQFLAVESKIFANISPDNRLLMRSIFKQLLQNIDD